MEGMRFTLYERFTALLGEEPLTVRLTGPCETGVFPVDRSTAYEVTQAGRQVVITPVRSRSALLLGWAPVFYFTGRLQGDSGEASLLQGRITMKRSFKWFYLAWVGFVVVGLTFGSFYSLHSAFRWLLTPTESTLAALQGAGLMAGTGVSLLFFAAFMFLIMRVLNRNERQKLKDFCRSIGQPPAES